MERTGRVLVIEELTNLHLLVLPFLLGRYGSILYVHWGRLLPALLGWVTRRAEACGVPFRKLEFADYPGSYVEVQEELYFQANDALLGKYGQNLYRTLMTAFTGDPLFLAALSKEFFNRYAKKRVKSLILLRHVLEDSPHVTFVPVDNEEIHGYLSPPWRETARYTVPPVATSWNRVRKAVSSLLPLLLPVFLLGIVIRQVRRGIALCPPPCRHYSLGFDILSVGLKSDRGLINGQFFLYDRDHFHPSRILHVVRHQLEDDEARRSLEQFGAPWVEMDRIRIPARYFLGRVVGDFLCRTTLRALLRLRRSDLSSALLVPALAVMKVTMEMEIFSLAYDVDLFIARDEYSPSHIVRTCVAHRCGNRTIAFQWADNIDRGELTSHFVFDCYALWGSFYRDYLKKTLEHSRTAIIGANIYGADAMHAVIESGEIPDRYRELRKQYTLVGILGSSFSPEIYLTREMTLRFYRDALEVAGRYGNAFCILKPKYKDLDRELQEMVRSHPRAAIEDTLHTYQFLPAVDVVICICASSVGLESLMAGKKVIYYEVSNWRTHPYAAYSPHLVAFTREELERNVERVLGQEQYLAPDLLDEIRMLHGYRFDGHVTDRFRELCRDILADMEKKPSPSQAGAARSGGGETAQ